MRAIAAVLAALATAGSIALAPVASADATSTGPNPTPTQTGGDPQVPFGSGFDFSFNTYDGNSLAY